jgi:hypothetical protein
MYCPSCAKEIPEESRFCLGCGKTIHVVAGGAQPEKPTSASRRASPARTRNALIVLSVLLGLAALAVFNEASRGTAADSPSSPHLFKTSVAKVDKLASGQIVVRAGSIWFTRFTVDTSTMSNVRVVGRFTAAGAFGNDIAAILTDEDDFENWKNGHPARALYSTGPTTVSNINAAITAPGTYYLAFSNKFSLLMERNVSAEVELHYTVRE